MVVEWKRRIMSNAMERSRSGGSSKEYTQGLCKFEMIFKTSLCSSFSHFKMLPVNDTVLDSLEKYGKRCNPGCFLFSSWRTMSVPQRQSLDKNLMRKYLKVETVAMMKMSASSVLKGWNDEEVKNQLRLLQVVIKGLKLSQKSACWELNTN